MRLDAALLRNGHINGIAVLKEKTHTGKGVGHFVAALDAQRRAFMLTSMPRRVP
jgi:hypothetical protein